MFITLIIIVLTILGVALIAGGVIILLMTPPTAAPNSDVTGQAPRGNPRSARRLAAAGIIAFGIIIMVAALLQLGGSVLIGQR